MLPYDERVICKLITIGRNCWLGSQVIILCGVTIGEGAVVGAGSVVSKDIPPYAVVYRNPAKVVKYRNLDVYQKLATEQKQIMRVFDSYKRIKIIKEKKQND
ncbi:MAG: acyltransferase [Christensenellaceae bacterium]